MSTVLLCLTGSTEIIPSVKNSIVVKGDYRRIQSILEEDIHNSKQVNIVGSGDMAYSAASLAIKYEKKCFINKHWFEFRKNASKKLTYLEAQMLLTSQCTEEKLFKEAASRLVATIEKSSPAKFSIEDANKFLTQSAPNLILGSGDSATEYLLNSFKAALNDRRERNQNRIQVTPDNNKIIVLEMNYSEVADYIFNNPGQAYALTAPKGFGKTEIIKQLFEKYSASESQALLVTSTVTLTNALCSDKRNYKNALETGSIDKLPAIASCLYSAMLTPAFKNFREKAKVVIFEEYESCRDALTADIVGKTGSLEEKASAQSAFNETLKSETVILTDAHLGQQSADHFIRTTGRKLFVIKPIVEHKNPVKKLTYFANRNVAIQNVRNIFDDNKKRGLTMSDCKHSGGKSKFRAMDIEINKGFYIKNIAVDAAFFAQEDNMKHMQNPTDFVNQYDHVLSTSVWRNGISMFSNFDLVTMICHQTVAPLDVLQWAERDRPNINKALYVNDVPTDHQIYWDSIFHNELKKGILATEVEEKAKLLKNNRAAKDIIDRIQYNNKMRRDYANNVLTMFELQGYDIEYNYSKSSKALNQRENNAKIEEKSERLSIYKTLDFITKMNELRDIDYKEAELRHINEKRLKYASDVFNYYDIDANADEELFKKVFAFDCDGFGRTKIENLLMTINSQKSKYYTLAAKQVIFKKLFQCLELDLSLKGEFSKQNFDKFFNWMLNDEISFGNYSEKVITVFKSLFPHIRVTNSTWVVKGLLSKEFGLEIEKVERTHESESGEVIKSNPTILNKVRKKPEYLMMINRANANELLFFRGMAYPHYKQAEFREAQAGQQLDMIDINIIAKGDDEELNEYLEHVFDIAI